MLNFLEKLLTFCELFEINVELELKIVSMTHSEKQMKFGTFYQKTMFPVGESPL